MQSPPKRNCEKIVLHNKFREVSESGKNELNITVIATFVTCIPEVTCQTTQSRHTQGHNTQGYITLNKY